VVVGVGENLMTTITILSTSPNLDLRNHPITIKAITEISQSPIDSTKINLNIESGVNYNEKFSKATTGVSVNVCGSEEEVKLSFPISASGINCEEGYCDAKQAAEFLAKQIDIALKRAKSSAYSAQEDIQALACGTQQFCTFGQIGASPETIQLYMKNDNLSVGALREAIDEISSGTSTGFREESTDYLIRRIAVSDDFVNFVATTGLNNNLFIDEELTGCGHYRITINGAFPYDETGVDFLNPTAVIRVEDKFDTAECEDSIQNVNNFLPVDEEYTIDNDRGTWASTIDSVDNDLDALAESISEELFGSERFGNGNGNKIIVSEEALGDALAELCIGSGEKKEVLLKVSPMPNDEQQIEAFENQVKEMVVSAVNGNFGKNCVVRNDDKYSCIKLRELGGIDALKIKVDPTTLLLSKDGGTVNGIISSSIGETINFDITRLQSETGERFRGIRTIEIRDKDTKEVYYSEEYIGTARPKVLVNKEIILEPSDIAETGGFAKEIEIFASPGNFETASNSDASKLSANGSKFKIRAINKTASDSRGKESEEIRISAGTLHPDDLIKILFEQKERITKRGVENPYYFTITWAGEPDQISLDAHYRSYVNSGRAKDYVNIGNDGTGLLVNSDKVNNTLDLGRQEAINSYFKWCAGVAGICNATGGVVGSAIGIAADCGIPAFTMMKSEVLAGNRTIRNFWENPVFKSISETEFLPDFVQNWFKVTPVEDALSTHDYSAQSFSTGQVVLGGTSGGVAKVLRGMGNLSSINIAGTTDTIVDDLGTQYAKEAEKTLKKLGFGADDAKSIAGDFADDYKKKLSPKLRDAFKKAQSSQKVVSVKSAARGRLINEATAQKTLTDTLKSNSPDLGAYLKDKGIIERAINNGSIDDVIKKLPEYRALYESDAVSKNLYDYLGATKENGSYSIKATDGTAARETVERSVDDLIDELATTKGLDPVDFSDLADDLKRGINLSSTDEVFNVEPAVRKISRRLDVVSKGTEYPELFRPTTSQIDEISAAISKSGIEAKPGSVTDDALRGKAGFRGKLTKILKPKFLANIGLGVACGIAANMVGMRYYDKTLENVTRNITNQASSFEDALLNKNGTYRMILTTDKENGKLDAEFVHVTGEELTSEMANNLQANESGERKGTILVWDKKLNEETPEKRPVQIPLMDAELNKLKQKLFSIPDIEEDEVDDIATRIAQNETQQLIYKYSNVDSRNRIFIEGENVIPESYVGALAVTLPSYSTPDKQREINGNLSTLKDKLNELITLVNASGSTQITREIAKELFSNDSDAELFYNISAVWDEVSVR
jgi:hypothetical protein